MQMISHPIDGMYMVFVFLARTVDVTKKMVPPFASQKILPAMNGENDV
jgi:hypothetical protein